MKTGSRCAGRNAIGRRLIYLCLVALMTPSVLLPASVNAGDLGVYAGMKAGVYSVDTSDGEAFHTAWGPIAGFTFNPYIAAEVEYLTLERDDDGDYTFKGDIWIASLRPTLPLSERWALYAKLGWAWPEGEAESNYAKGFVESDDDFFGGFGFIWKPSRFHLRGELQSNFSTARDNNTDYGIATLTVRMDL